jgi:hypothetical protein
MSRKEGVVGELRHKGVNIVLLFGAALCLLAAACGSSASGSEAIRAAISKHLDQRSDLKPSAFDIDIQQVTIQGDHAQADAIFHAKGGPGTMQLHYELTKNGDGWTVTQATPVGVNGASPVAGPTQPVAPGSETTPSTFSFEQFDNDHFIPRSKPASPSRRPPSAQPAR